MSKENFNWISTRTLKEKKNTAGSCWTSAATLEQNTTYIHVSKQYGNTKMEGNNTEYAVEKGKPGYALAEALNISAPV